ncbi:MAG: hypothetical protein LBE33_05850 [Zoogloeaceae bacterium]|jgi:hypothetical protein|nr:hypothetical protein [Zoogloeaceae bacterium]
MMNPEFRRNLWLSFSTHRLIAMPALLGLVFATAAYSLSNPGKALYITASALFILIVWLWGAINANAAIIEEFRDKTWDQQRMSALGPWTMAWGKLFGATSFNWYGGLLCLLALVFSGIAVDQPDWPLDLFSLIAGGILLHAALIALNLHAARFEMRLIRRGGLGWLVIAFAVLFMQGFIWSARSPLSGVWWGITIDNQKFFLLASALLFMVCAVFAAWRLMSNALQVRTLPWAWPLFVIILTVYFGGFSRKESADNVFLLGFFIAAGLSYLMLFTEPNTLLVWNKLRARRQAGDWRGWLADLPLWPTTVLLAFIFAMIAMPTLTAGLSVFPLVTALLLLRDACIVLFFSFAPNARRPVSTAILYIAVINLLLPFFFGKFGWSEVAHFFNPYFSLGSRAFFGGVGGSGIDLLIAGIHAAIALGFVAWRLNRAARQ